MLWILYAYMIFCTILVTAVIVCLTWSVIAWWLHMSKCNQILMDIAAYRSTHDQVHVRRIVKWMQHKDGFYRSYTASSLGDLPAHTLQPFIYPLRDLLVGEDPFARRSASQTLLKMKTEASVILPDILKAIKAWPHNDSTLYLVELLEVLNVRTPEVRETLEFIKNTRHAFNRELAERLCNEWFTQEEVTEEAQEGLHDSEAETQAG